MEALWRTLMESFKAWQERNNKQSTVDLNQFADGIASHFNNSSQPLLQEKVGEFTSATEDYLADLTQYIEENEKNPTFVFWIQYMQMIETLLLFLRSERTGDWDLHLATFKDMSWVMIHDHTNYSRWRVVYLLDMLQLPESCPDVWNEFKAGNLVVKENQGSFNQISPDLALEHINKQCKIAGGLVGITKHNLHKTAG